MIEILHFVQNDREKFRMTGRVPDDRKGPDGRKVPDDRKGPDGRRVPDDRRGPMTEAISDKHLLRPWRFLQ